ncbi:MAG: tRNA preQ1(34) S-adenosylmethionine ribosyltransferase-isomerase QueA [Candidatus Omnitrophica bacterium]|nr:tRNA preQ1(34) S-adenosylmethionine ribosyltransferase-isomerase QueA [Candidatus Omnitrophota bacterium]
MSSHPLSLQSYFYKLPESLIAQYPLPKRDQARLMVLDRRRQSIVHDVFAHINRYLPSMTTLVVNNSKVIPARLLARKVETHGTDLPAGRQVEIFLLRALEDGYSFEALLKPLKKIRLGQTLDCGSGLQAQLVDKEQRIVRFNRKNVLKFLQKTGHIPLPPYIKRQDEASDRRDYQTVYAKQSGSVAAPTAGLHFTRGLMGRLKKEGHRFLELTLHINYGTFKPVECEDIRFHSMHEEIYAIAASVYERILKTKKSRQPICAVGTTSCRVLESIAQGSPLKGAINLFIYPGFPFTMTDCLVTNFHLPYSSLLMLVCAFGGYDLMMRSYQEAIKEKYRFYSYGDAMLIV